MSLEQQLGPVKKIVSEASGYSSYRRARDEKHLGILKSCIYGVETFFTPSETRLELEMGPGQELKGSARLSVRVRDVSSIVVPALVMTATAVVAQDNSLAPLAGLASKFFINGVIHHELDSLSKCEYNKLVTQRSSTGDELENGDRRTEPGEVPPGNIQVQYTGIQSDNVVWHDELLDRLATEVDLRSRIIINNGSLQPHPTSTSDLGEVLAWKRSAKPGEPLDNSGFEYLTKYDLHAGEMEITIDDKLIADKITAGNQGVFDTEQFTYRLDLVARAGLAEAIRLEKKRQLYLGAGRMATSLAVLGSTGYAFYRSIESIIGIGEIFAARFINILHGANPYDTPSLVYPVLTFAASTMIVEISTGILRYNRILGRETFPGYKSTGYLNPFKHLKGLSQGRRLLEQEEVELVSLKEDDPTDNIA